MLKSVAAGWASAVVVLLVPGLASAQAPALGPRSEPAVKRFVVYGVHTREQRSLLVREGYDIGEAYWPDHVELFGSDKQAWTLALRGFRVVPSEEPDDFPPEDEAYHNYAEMVADLEAVAAAHPQTVHLFSLGQSYEGRELVGVRISNDATDNLAEPGVFFVGQHHAREHLTVEVVLSLVHLFAEPTKVRIGNLVHKRQIYIVPSLNPDGGEYDIATGSYRSGARTGSRTRASTAPTRTATTATSGAAAAGRAATGAARPIAGRSRSRRPKTRAWPTSCSPIRTSRPGSATTRTAT